MSKINIQTDTVGVLNSGRVRGGSLDLTLASGTAPFMRAASAPASPTVGQWYMDSATGALSFCQSAGSWTALSTAVVSGAVAGAGNIPATAGLIAFGSGTAGTITTDTAFTYTPGANPYAQIGSTVQVVLQSLGGSSYGRIGTISNHPFHIVTNNSNRLSFEASGAATFALTIAAKGGTIQDTTAVTGSTLFTITPGAAQTAASTVLSVGGAATFASTVKATDFETSSGAYLMGATLIDWPTVPAAGGFIGIPASGSTAPFNKGGSIFYRARASDSDGYGDHVFYTGETPTERFRIAATGAATFASTVTATGDLYLTTAAADVYLRATSAGANASLNLITKGAGAIGINYGSTGTGAFTYYGGTTAAKMSVTNTGAATFAATVQATGYKTTTTTVTSTATLTAVQTSGTVLSNYGQSAEATLTLPAAAEGLGLTFIVTTTGNALHIKAGASDKIYLDGAALDDGDKVSLATPAVGDAVSCLAFRSGESTWDWLCTSIAGAWTDGGA